MSSPNVALPVQQEIELAEYSRPIASELQRIAFWLADNENPVHQYESATATLVGDSRMRAYSVNESEKPFPRYHIEFKNIADTIDCILKTSPSGNIWKGKNNSFITPATFRHLVRSIVSVDALSDEELFSSTPGASYDHLMGWLLRQKSATFDTDSSYESDDPGLGVAAQFNMQTGSSLDALQQSYTFEITDTLRLLSGAVVARTVHIDSTETTNLTTANEKGTPYRTSQIQAALSLQSDDLTQSELRRYLSRTKMGADDVFHLTKSGENRFNASNPRT